VPTQTGNYKVRITDSNGCVLRYSIDYYQTITTGIAQVNSLLQFNLYPNPTNGIVIIDAPGLADNFQVIITDEIGKTLRINQSNNIIDLTSFEQGIYFITVVTPSGERATKRISYIR
jgi:hypothetical protein